METWTRHVPHTRWIGAASLLTVSACAAGAGPAGAGVNADDRIATTVQNGADAAVSTSSCSEELVGQLRAEIDVCRSCHVKNGLAGGTRFLLDEDANHDEAKLRAAYGVLGRELIAEPAEEDGRKHGGGKLLREQSPAYDAWDALVTALAKPDAACSGDVSAVGSTTAHPLLGSSHGGHVWSRYCAGKPDDAELPADPRTLVKPGTNDERAVHFNAYWSWASMPTCRAPTTSRGSASATTCSRAVTRILRSTARTCSRRPIPRRTL